MKRESGPRGPLVSAQPAHEPQFRSSSFQALTPPIDRPASRPFLVSVKVSASPIAEPPWPPPPPAPTARPHRGHAAGHAPALVDEVLHRRRGLEDHEHVVLDRAELEAGARATDLHEGVLLRLVVMHHARAAAAADDEADAVGGEHRVARRLGDLRPSVPASWRRTCSSAAAVAFSASACFSALVAAKAPPVTSDSDSAPMPRMLLMFMLSPDRARMHGG